jgi:dTDP-L-rhamnose 4-epimerase
MAESVLVTGGAGFLGSHLVDALVARGDRVRVLDSLLPQAHPTGSARFLSKQADLVVGDLRDRPTVDRALEGVTAVFHLGALVGNGHSMVHVRDHADGNVVGTATLLEAMSTRAAQFRRLVHASSMIVYGDGAYACVEHGSALSISRPWERLAQRKWDPICNACGREVYAVPTPEDHPLRPTSTYGITKLAQEHLVLTLSRAYDIAAVALRFLNLYGPRQALSNPSTGVVNLITTRLLNGKAPLVFEDGQQRRDLLHVSDAVRALLAAAEAGPRAHHLAINVGTGSSITVAALAKKMAKLLRVSFEPKITQEFREGDVRHCYPDVGRARELLGWEAKIPFDKGLRELAAWAAQERPEDRTDEANAELRARNIIRA